MHLKLVYEFADVMTVEEWHEHVAMGAFIPDDGNGYYAIVLNGEYWEFVDSDVWKVDSRYKDYATHVAWYNR